mgnify:CR=1 FL=1
MEWRQNAKMKTGPYSGAIAPEYCHGDFLEAIRNLPQLLTGGDSRSVVTGRHRHAKVIVSCAGAPRALFVKAFAPEPLLKDWIDRWRGSKAQRTWRAATFLEKNGIGTPKPVGFIERRQNGRLVESYFLTEYESEVSSFRDELIRLFREDPECWKFMALLRCVAEAIRKLHTTGFLHNDLGNQNILLRRLGDGLWGNVQFIDLNRSRIRAALTLRERARDISRIYLPSDFLRVFKEMYFAPVPPPQSFQKWEWCYRTLYAWHCRTRVVRHPVRAWRRRHEADASNQYPCEKDMWVWDERSGQPVNVLRSADRRRYQRPGDVLLTAGAVIRAAPAVWAEYRRLMATCFQTPVAMQGRIGVAVTSRPEYFDRELELLAALGKTPVLVRFYHHQCRAAWDWGATVVRELRRRGHAVTAALVQDRQAVREPRRWTDFLGYVLGRVADEVEWFELGHAVNRVKWGIWSLDEYRRLLAASQEALRQFPHVRLIGPAAIDFEYAALLAALNQRPPGLHFAALSHLLYVDRRGAPENRQHGFGALDKFALARAIARWAPECADRLIISEVNWPLLGTGEYSPVGAPYESPGPRFDDPSVSEDEYADYMLRYVLMALCSGLVDRVYWWRLVAHGFGLVDDRDPHSWRLRPAFGVLKWFLELLGDSRFTNAIGLGPAAADCRRRQFPSGCWLRFERPDGELVWIGYNPWSAGQAPLPCRAARVVDAFGRELGSAGIETRLDGRPVYLRGCSS